MKVARTVQIALAVALGLIVAGEQIDQVEVRGVLGVGQQVRCASDRLGVEEVLNQRRRAAHAVVVRLHPLEPPVRGERDEAAEIAAQLRGATFAQPVLGAVEVRVRDGRLRPRA